MESKNRTVAVADSDWMHFEEFDLHTPEVKVDSGSGMLWEESSALVEGMEAGSLEELVGLLDLPNNTPEINNQTETLFRFTNHCSTFGTEDLWPI